MIGYTKLFQEIITSTIWQESNDVKAVWITLLALKGRDQVARATVPSLARLNNLSIEDTEKIIKKLKSPDPYSRSNEFNGRRIEPVDGGFLILNGEKYQHKMSQEERRAYNAKKQREYYWRKKGKPVPDSVKTCNRSGKTSALCTHTDSDTDSDTKKRKRSKGTRKKESKRATKRDPAPSTVFIEYFCEAYEQNIGKPYPVSWGRDRLRLKPVLAVRKPEDLFPAVDKFFNDPFWKKTGFDIPKFVKYLPQFDSKVSTGKPSKSGGEFGEGFKNA